MLCTPAERACFQAILKLGFLDSFRLSHQEAGHYSWWDYRNAAFRRGQGLRIDHILISQRLEKRFVNTEIDQEPRKAERPSDHAPVILTLEH